MKATESLKSKLGFGYMSHLDLQESVLPLLSIIQLFRGFLESGFDFDLWDTLIQDLRNSS